MPDHPTYEQLVTLPAYAVQPVPVAFEDNNGQLNVRHYLGIGSEGLRLAGSELSGQGVERPGGRLLDPDLFRERLGTLSLALPLAPSRTFI